MTQISIFHQEYQQRVKKKKNSIEHNRDSAIIDNWNQRPKIALKGRKKGEKKSPITKRIRNERGESISHSLRKTNGISPRVAPLLEREQTAAARSNSRCIYAIKKARMHVGTWGEAGGLLNSCLLPRRPIDADHLLPPQFLFFSFFFFPSLLHIINLRERACTHTHIPSCVARYFPVYVFPRCPPIRHPTRNVHRLTWCHGSVLTLSTIDVESFDFETSPWWTTDRLPLLTTIFQELDLEYSRKLILYF